MIQLDTQLIHAARHFCTDVNVLHVTQFITSYQDAVKQSAKRHQTYKAGYEQWLRTFVASAGYKMLDRDPQALKEYCSELNDRSVQLNAEIDRYLSDGLPAPNDRR